MLINISNHPKTSWQSPQLKAAKIYGNIIDLPFPKIPPEATTTEVEVMVIAMINEVQSLMQQHQNPPTVVHLMGEMTFTYALTNKLRAQGIPCIASTTERVVTMQGDIKKTVFTFIQFRPYF